jgi:hypothetical protein
LSTKTKAFNLSSKHLPKLKDKLEQIAKTYNKPLTEVVIDLEGVSGDLRQLLEFYDTSKLGMLWIDVEDDILKTKATDDPFFVMIVHNKGVDAVRRRLRFLKIENKSI